MKNGYPLVTLVTFIQGKAIHCVIVLEQTP